MQANLIMGGGPHIKARVVSEAGGKCLRHMAVLMKPCVHIEEPRGTYQRPYKLSHDLI